MNIVYFNLNWMSVNIILAVIPVVFGWFSFKTRQKPLKILFLIIWLAFIPNTIYIITDVLHIPRQLLETENLERIIILLQYFILEVSGFITFIISLSFFERILMLSRFKENKELIDYLIILMNFAIGFGVVLGRIQRANSWEVFTNTEKIVNDTLGILTSLELVLLALFFGCFGNFLYLSFKNRLLGFFSKTSIFKKY